MLEQFQNIQPIVIATLTAILAVVVSGHVVLNKRDTRSAVAWVGLVWLVPVLGSFLYFMFGINRIRRRGQQLRALGLDIRQSLRDSRTDWAVVTEQLPERLGHLGRLARMVNRVTLRPLVAGNTFAPLTNGDEAYPQMIAAIDGAQRSVALSTFIFDYDDAGRRFADALGRALTRGVEVRVLIDALGARYSWPSMVGKLRKRKIRVARFMQAVLPWHFPFLNLRTHRKILVVDGVQAFTGGMNIRNGHVLEASPKRPVQDMHFRISGPVVEHCMQSFAEDWAFSTKEVLVGESWFPQLEREGSVIARGISDGPGEDFDKLRMTMLGGIVSAQSSIVIVTPYFLPDRDLISSLQVAAMRDVDVTIVLPAQNNHFLVKWASTALLWQLLSRGCRVYMTPGPFDHTKLMLVDNAWTLLGSANWDPRSLRLNFEFNVECYDEALTERLAAIVQKKVATARQVTLRDVDRRSLPTKLRDGVARLFSPYL